MFFYPCVPPGCVQEAHRGFFDRGAYLFVLKRLCGRLSRPFRFAFTVSFRRKPIFCFFDREVCIFVFLSVCMLTLLALLPFLYEFWLSPFLFSRFWVSVFSYYVCLVVLIVITMTVGCFLCYLRVFCLFCCTRLKNGIF